MPPLPPDASPAATPPVVCIVGAPRSGTSLLYQLLRLHPSLAWITPVTNRCFAGPAVGWTSRLPFERSETAAWLEWLAGALPGRLTPPRWRGPHDGSLNAAGLPETSEGFQIWRSQCPAGLHHRLTEADLTGEAVAYFRRVARGHAAHFGRPRLLIKCPRHVLRLRYFAAAFGLRVQFVHLVRDGRAVAASILRRRRRAGSEAAWWGLKPPGWRRVQRKQPPVVQCGWTWARCHEIARRDSAGFPEERCHRVRYEALTARPAETLGALREALGLPASPAFRHALGPHLGALENRNDRWRTRLSPEQQRALLAEIEDALRREGYGGA